MKWSAVIAVLAFSLPSSAAPTDLKQVAREIDEFLSVDCPEVTGDAKAKLAIDLARQKNREDEPSTFQKIPFADLLKEGDDTDRWSDVAGAVLEGYVIDVKPGGVETCNCRTTDMLFKDTHIELIAAKDDPGAKKDGTFRRVIVEVTPRFRLIKAQDGVDWTTDTLRQTIKGHYVRVKGWMFHDKEHECAAQNTRKEVKPACHGRDRTVWRATTWEIHPLTSIEVLPGKPPN